MDLMGGSFAKRCLPPAPPLLPVSDPTECGILRFLESLESGSSLARYSMEAVKLPV